RILDSIPACSASSQDDRFFASSTRTPRLTARPIYKQGFLKLHGEPGPTANSFPAPFAETSLVRSYSVTDVRKELTGKCLANTASTSDSERFQDRTVHGDSIFPFLKIIDRIETDGERYDLIFIIPL